MAAPSLQDVLAAVPAVAEQVDGMTELLPGVPSSKENLNTRWQYINRADGMPFALLDDADGMCVFMEGFSTRKGKYQNLRVIVQGKPENCRRDNRTYLLRPQICSHTDKNTDEGFFECLLFAKRSLKRYREEGPCPACMSSSDEAVQPVKKLKAMRMPQCEKCMLKAIVGVHASA